MARDPSVIIIGAGMAGLTAASELGRAGLSVLILEARERIGGRVFPLHDPASPVPIELGAEFIHGKPREIWDPLDKAKVKITEVDGDYWCFSDERLTTCDLFSEVESILDQMDDSDLDESFVAFLERRFPHPTTKQQREAQRHAINYVSGFNAADPSLVGVHWLVQGARAEEKIEGDRAFRSEDGYQDLLEIFQRQIASYGVEIRTGTIVDTVRWHAQKVTVSAHNSQGTRVFEAPHGLITLPLSLLKACRTTDRVGTAALGCPAEQSSAGLWLPAVVEIRSTGQQRAAVPTFSPIHFSPQLPDQKFEAMDKLEMGKVIRVSLRFRERFWETIKPPGLQKNLSKMVFLFSQDEWFPTWWTSMPRKSPLITGWAPFRSAEKLSGQGESFVIERSLKTLSSLLGPRQQELENLLERAYVHDWQTDPFSMGAYSYGKVGSDGAQQTLAAPLDNTLFFAGEATDITGHNGTVHGAIASGYRAAQEILRVCN